MGFIEQRNRFIKLHEPIKKRITGTPKEFAKQLGISRSYLYRSIEALRNVGALISYSRKRATFYY